MATQTRNSRPRVASLRTIIGNAATRLTAAVFGDTTPETDVNPEECSHWRGAALADVHTYDGELVGVDRECPDCGLPWDLVEEHADPEVV